MGIMTVTSRYLQSASRILLLRLYPAFMSGDNWLETFAPSEYLALERGLRVPGPAFFLRSLGVDARWECDEVCKIQSRGKPFATGELLAVPPPVFPLFIYRQPLAL